MSKTDTVALHRQYGVFREYLASYFAAGARGRASAKDKLHRLPQEQFSDVSTDVHDEINRRLNSRDRTCY